MRRVYRFVADHKSVLSYILLIILSFFESFYFLKNTDPFNDQLGYALITFVFYFFLNQFSQKLLKVFIVISFFTCLFIFPTLQVYGQPDSNMVVAILHTNFSESNSYLKTVPTSVILQVVALGIYCLGLLFLDYKKLKWPWTVVAGVVLIFMPVKKMIENNGFNVDEADTFVNVSPMNRIVYFAKESYIMIREDHFVKAQLKKPDTWNVISKEPIPSDKVFVIVVGESARRDFFHTYGFPIKDSPFIDSSTRIQFNNYIAPAAQTIPSLTRVLALSKDLIRTGMNDNIINLSKKLGYTTYWISNQGKFGFYDSPITVIAESGNHSVFMTQGDYASAIAKSDFDMLDPLEKFLAQKNVGPKLIVLHMMGSHPYACARTHNQYDVFLASKEMSCYVQTIKNTDSFLQAVYNRVKLATPDFQMVYFSDHGLAINKDLGIVHGNNQQSYNIPLFVWGSDITKTRIIKPTRTGDRFLQLFLELNHAKVSNIDYHHDFLSNEDFEKDPKIVNPNGVIVPYSSLENDPIKPFLKKYYKPAKKEKKKKN